MKTDTKPDFSIGAGGDALELLTFLRVILTDLALWSQCQSIQSITLGSRCCTLTAFQVTERLRLVPGMIAYWPFDNASDLVDKVAGIEGEAQGTVDDAEGHLGGAVDFGAGNTENWIKVDAEATTWLAAASDNDAMSVSFWQKLHAVKSASTIWFRAEAAGSQCA